MKYNGAHLAYCTNIHPAESWDETWSALKKHTLAVRDKVLASNKDKPFAIGLRLSAQAADDLLEFDAEDMPFRLLEFKSWLEKENCYVFTINGFPYGNFHGEKVKEKVYQPDWTTPERLEYTNQLFIILAELLPDGVDGSVSTLPASFKEFKADEHLIFSHLYACARFLEILTEEYGKELHLGLEPEPLGHFENTEETLAFFERFQTWATEKKLSTTPILRYIGINYDTCHFALEFENCFSSLQQFQETGIKISKVHLSSALSFNPQSPEALDAIREFHEPTYLHQVLLKHPDGTIKRFKDLPCFFDLLDDSPSQVQAFSEGRVHFHIPLYASPKTPLGSTRDHAKDALTYLKKHPDFCTHFEIETYTWGVLPQDLQQPVETQIAEEYEWVFAS